jgi:anaerobic selenocysteine-containing dehydrogenase
MHNFQRLVKGDNRCTLMMNPSDLEDRNLTDGDVVRIESRAGGVQVPVEACAELMAGVVCLPHGYGHNRDGIQMEVAVQHAGVSINDVTDEQFLDALSGNAAVNGVPVTVSCS